MAWVLILSFRLASIARMSSLDGDATVMLRFDGRKPGGPERPPNH